MSLAYQTPDVHTFTLRLGYGFTYIKKLTCLVKKKKNRERSSIESETLKLLSIQQFNFERHYHAFVIKRILAQHIKSMVVIKIPVNSQ